LGSDIGKLAENYLSGSVPSGSVPSGSVPSGSVRSGSVPSGSVPSGSVPSGSVPSGSVPSGSVPSGRSNDEICGEDCNLHELVGRNGDFPAVKSRGQMEYTDFNEGFSPESNRKKGGDERQHETLGHHLIHRIC